MSKLLFFTMPSMTELLLIGAVLLLFFGGRKIPELMRGIGKGISEFKKGVKGKEPDQIDNP